ncbi:PP2C family protein-serine/threonine phosphatase [Shewanella frigidimarina]|uniref:Protein serine/threonine phosphatase n=1 Tax=Shewanella frigidimarina (strain NCIMB 400) TaxID=318167 RepID=Q080U9_SHEFN|nr:protein phosphatase 2C domain-containing protein [Shewanella frigidimarina]ABI72216.1 protein serine/threonine phosphatase [Shewanella frigidimarina NCIMB 400]RPA27297.1 serine/threonine-protein phosphatase [Shewanella frigidimarina]
MHLSHALTHRGTVRSINEDAYLELPHLGIWVVADGMGGHAAGDVASQLVIDGIQQAVEHLQPETITLDILKQSLISSNRFLQQMSEHEFDGKVAGSTVVVLWLYQDNYHLLWVGDSRIYLLRDQQMKQVTKDHSQVNDMIDEGLLQPEEAESHPLANVITRAVGVDSQLDIDYRTDNMKEGDVFLLCSDGLNKELNDVEIERTIKSGNIIDSGMALLHASLVRNARDNVTCILVKNTPKKINSIDDSDKTIPIFG